MKNIYPLFLSAHFAVLALLLFGYQGIVQAQPIFSNPITGTNPNTSDPYTTGQTVNANLTVSGIGRGTGINGTNANDRYNANGWNTNNLDLDAYFEWVITPNAGFQIDFVSLVYTGQRSGTGPNSFALRSSADGFTSNIGAPTATGNITLSAAAYQSVTSAITFRLYGWATTNSGGTFSVNDFTFNGTVAPIPMVSIETIDADAAEAGPATGTFRISRTGSTTAALEVDYTLGGSASSADYAPLLSGTVTIPVGQSFTDLTITPIDDDLVEGTEMLTLTLVDGAAYDLSADVSATVNIEDNDFAYLTFSPAGASVSEGAGVYTSNVRLLIDSSPAGGTLQDAVTVQLEGVELAAANGATFADFMLMTPSVTFPAGSGNGATQPFEVTIVDDNLVEGNEFFDVAMVQTGYTGVPSIVQDNQVIPGLCNGNNNDCRNRQTIQITDNDLPDYTITTTGNAIVITDLSGNGETLEVTENGTNIRFNAAGRIYTINGGAGLSFPADVPLAGAASITINAAGGDDIINIGAFTVNLPDLTINGGTGDDVVNFNGDITFAADADLDVDMQNDDATPGLDQVTIAANANLILSGTGMATVKVSRYVDVNSGSSIETANGNLTVEANQQATPTPGSFFGILINGGALRTSGSGTLTVKGKGGTAAVGGQKGIFVVNSGQISGGSSGAVLVTGTGGPSAGNFNDGVFIDANGVITSLGGDVSVTGLGNGTGSSETHFGIFVRSGGQITAGGTGTVTVHGTGGATAGSNNRGVVVFDTNAHITSSGGNVNVTGQGGGTGSSGANWGVYLLNAGQITAGGSGAVTVNGTGGAFSGNTNFGVFIEGINARITSSGGNVSVTGQGGGSGNSGSNFGVYLLNGGEISASSTGSVSVEGQGGNTTANNNYGVYVNGNNAKISSSGGNITVTGQVPAGSGASQAVRIENNGQVSATTGTPSVTIIGNSMQFLSTLSIDAGTNTVTLRPLTTGTPIDLGGDDVLSGTLTLGLTQSELNGITAGILRIGSTSTTHNAQITIRSAITEVGTGWNTLSLLSNSSIQGNISQVSGATLTVTNLKVFSSENVVLTEPGNTVLQISGISAGLLNFVNSTSLTVGSVDPGTGFPGLQSVFGNKLNVTVLGAGSVLTVNNAINQNIFNVPSDVLLSADAMAINAAIIAPNNKVTLRPVTAGRAIDLGSETANTLSLTGTELNQITAGTLVLGDANSGDMSITAAIALAAAPDVELHAGSDIVFDGGSLDIGSGDLLLAPGDSPAAVKPLTANTDATAGTVSFASDLAITINGTTVDTEYTQFKVVGEVDLTGVDLILSGTHMPVIGNTFTIVDNDGVDAIIGTFNGLPEGERISNFFSSGLDAIITYMGGDGNDVVLTVVPCPTITFTATPTGLSCSTSADGQIAISGEMEGTAPYMYSIDNGATYQLGATFTGLSADTYQVKIKDANGCESDAEAVVVAAPTCPATGTLTWTGEADTDWSNACNWDGGCVPAADNEVVIPDVANDPIITTGTAALAKSVNVQPDASLTLEAMSSLTLEGATGSPSGGMYNQGTVTNNGHIDIGPSISPGEYGLVNEGMFNNVADSELSIDRTSNIGLWNRTSAAELANAGKITVGATVGTSSRPGIYNEGDIQNNGGEIEIDRYGGAGIDNRPNSTISNSGRLAIGQLSGPLSTCIYNFGHIQNLADGEIELDNGNSGIFTTTTGGVSSSFTNAGKIAIGQIAPLNGPGIYNQSAAGASASFNNMADAEILLDRTNAGIHNDVNCSFDNSGLIKIATTVTGTGFNSAIYNRSTFNNYAGAEIQMDRIPGTGLHHENGTFANGGKIIVGINVTITNFNPGVYNQATFVNQEDAEMHIDRFTHVGFLNESNSSMTNAGLIKIGENVLGGNNGLYNDGTFENQATGEIHVDNIPDANSTNGVFNASGEIFTNAGKLFIGSAVGGGSTGLFNSGTFDNSGEIAVDNIRGTVSRHGLFHNGDTFTNTGKIDLGNTGSIGDWGIFSQSTFNNNSGGEITIDRCAITGVRNGSFGFGGTFTNAGKITIGANASVGNWGLWNDSPFNNSGELNIDNATVTGLRHQNATFTNTGTVVLGGIASIGEWGLWNQSAFNNEADGEISIDRSSNTGLLNFLSTFTNKGVITIGAQAAVGDQALYNEATFDNDTCAVLNIHAPLHNVSTFTNSGLLYANTLAAHTNTGFANAGIIAYPQGNPIPNVTNDEIIVAPVTSNNCNTISPAFTLGSPVDFDILGVFTDEAGTLSAGTYETASNTFTPTASLAEDTYNYFVQIDDPVGGCTRTVPWSLTTENCTAISGNIVWEHDLSTPVDFVTVTLSGDNSGSDDTDAFGDYAIPTAGGNSLTLTPTRAIGNPYEGVDAADVTRIQQHVTFIDRLDDGYKVIAADVNLSNSVTGLDAAVVFHAINGNPNAQAIFETPSWRFVDSTHTFMDENAPWPFPDTIALMNVMADVLNQSFVGAKMGDVNGTWAMPVLLTSPPLSLMVHDVALKAGQTLRVPFRANGLPDVAAWQFALRFDTDYLRFVRALPTAAFPLKDENFGAWQADRGELRSVFAVPQGLALPKDEVIFELEFKVVYDGLQLSEVLRLDDGILDGRVYDTALNGGAVALTFEAVETRRIASLLPGEAALGFALEQNIPNPFSNETLVRFELPEAGEAVFSVHDVQGRMLYEQRGFLDAGRHEVRLDAARLGATGVLSYTLRTGAHSATRRMVLVR